MTKKKPDRFERMITHELVPSEVVKLLRKGHQAVVRMVKNERKQCRTFRDTSGSDFTCTAWACRMAGCDEILDQLKKRAT